MKINIIGDIHGNYKEFKELIKLMPDAEKNISIGDVIDRGNDSLKVIDYLMKNNWINILGNHDDMFLRSYDLENENLKLDNEKIHSNLGISWKLRTNGGFVLLNELDNRFEEDKASRMLYMSKVLEWFITNPIELEIDNLYISHAPYTMKQDKLKTDLDKTDFLWSFPTPRHLKKKFTIHGHTGMFDLFTIRTDFVIDAYQTPTPVNFNNGSGGWSDDEKVVSMGIDTMNEDKLMGIHIDTITLKYKIYEVEFDKDTFKEFNKGMGK